MPYDISHLLHGCEPNWRPHFRYRRSELPAGVRSWLLETGSLTRRIQCACPGAFAVRVLSQGWAKPQPSEVHALGMRLGGRAVVREVLLVCDLVPWVYARSVIPATTLRGRERRLNSLGSRSLGSYLFSQPSLRRERFDLARIGPGEPGYVAATGAEQGPAIWGRRSVFYVHGRPLLVGEVFLPTLPV